jgi:Sigma-70, region 4
MVRPIKWASARPCWLRCAGSRPGNGRSSCRYWEDLADAEIAAALGCTPGTVRSQLSRALAKLRVSPALREGDDR